MSTTERREELLRWLQAHVPHTERYGQPTRTIAFHFQGGAHPTSLIRSDLQALERQGMVERIPHPNGPIRWRLTARPEENHA